MKICLPHCMPSCKCDLYIEDFVIIKYNYCQFHINQNKKFISFKSKENIHKNEDGPDCTVSNNKSRQ